MAISAQEKALSCEALNRVPGLSPLARRVGLELINRSDRNTGRCKPSEGRLAISLACDERSVRRAKVELQQAGYLIWHNPGYHKRSHYQILWTRLVAVAQKLKRQIRKTATSAIGKAKHLRLVKLRRFISSQQINWKSDRTKMSGNLTTHIYQIVNNKNKAQETYDNVLREKAERRFWEDIQSLPRELSTKITNSLSEAAFEKALEEEKRVFGHGVKAAIETVEGQVAYV